MLSLEGVKPVLLAHTCQQLEGYVFHVGMESISQILASLRVCFAGHATRDTMSCLIKDAGPRWTGSVRPVLLELIDFMGV